jgi:hypothetical protein
MLKSSVGKYGRCSQVMLVVSSATTATTTIFPPTHQVSICEGRPGVWNVQWLSLRLRDVRVPFYPGRDRQYGQERTIAQAVGL